ncbi:hypothetical protein LTS18_008834 [Coniosporium uncinatum]|uniref:Uncharacterized protein n=1 Tax=Coniosporium uncinatum TaxID=93489 RepID=A0ACC3D132_9PEZI|nr:hypothetical protein LTS18_008834 [Coniosporium uncinatum]
MALAAQKKVEEEAAAKRNASNVNGVPDDELVDESEFANDPEIRNCLLSEREIEAKERIWVTFNEDWLRKRQAKDLKRQLDEAEGNTKKTVKRRGGKKKNDADATGGSQDAGAGGSPMSLAEENRAMMEKRKKGFSKHINYEKMRAIYAPDGVVESQSRSPDGGSSSNGAGGGGGVGGVGRRGRASPYEASDPNTPADQRQQQQQGEKMSVQAMMLKSRIMQGNMFGGPTPAGTQGNGGAESEAVVVEDVVSEDENEGDADVGEGREEYDEDNEEERDEEGDLESAIQNTGWGEEDEDDGY